MGLSDGDLVRNLLGTCCDLMDRGYFDAVGELFAAASLVDDRGRVLARGADEVAAYYDRVTRRYDDGTTRTKHLIANTVLEEGGVPGGVPSMTARSSFVVLQATSELPLQPIMSGRYVDRFVRAGGTWHFAERAFIVDQLGDMSKHLRFDTV